LAVNAVLNTNWKITMNSLHQLEKEPGFMPLQGRGSRQVCDHRLKVKVRRHERRKCRAVIRIWLGEGLAEETSG
jgi:hypothetical protein